MYLKLDQLASTLIGKTVGGVRSTCEAVLVKLVPCHPFPGILLLHRHLAKYKTTYVEGILGQFKIGKVYTIWDQVAAANS
jgi:DNA polymerase I-like protein with 3'-5' exonuclease and polymerase domains